MATLQSGKCFTVPTFFGMCCKVWMTGKDVYLQMTWSWPDKTWNILCSYCLQWNTSQSKFRNHYFLFLFAFSILSQLFLIWGCIIFMDDPQNICSPWVRKDSPHKNENSGSFRLLLVPFHAVLHFCLHGEDIWNNFGNQTVSGLIDFWLFLFFLVYLLTNILHNIFFCENDMRRSTWWHNFHFCVDYPLRRSQQSLLQSARN